MGSHPFISVADFPTQSDHLGTRVTVCFHYDASHSIGGTVVRDDVTDPWVMIIRLDDSRHVLATECMWQPQT